MTTQEIARKKYELDWELRHALEQAPKHHYLNVVASLSRAILLALQIHQAQLSNRGLSGD